MAKQSVEVISLLSSDEDSNSQIESATNAKIDIKSQKITARKSMQTTMGQLITTIKQDPDISVPNTSVTDVQKSLSSQVQIKPLKCTEMRDDPILKHTTARKSFQNSNSASTSRLKPVSILQNKLSLQCSKTDSKNEVISQSKLSLKAADAIIKLPEITIMPLQNSLCAEVIENVKPSQTARKSLCSQQLPADIQITSLHCKLAGTSLPSPTIKTNSGLIISKHTAKLSEAQISNNTVSTSVINEKLKNVKSSALSVISTAATSCNITPMSGHGIPGSLTVTKVSYPQQSRISDKMSDSNSSVSFQKLSEKGSSIKIIPSTNIKEFLQNSTPNVPTSLIASLGKTGLTVTKTSNRANESQKANISKILELSQKVSIEKLDVTISKSSKATISDNNLNIDSRETSESRLSNKDTDRKELKTVNLPIISNLNNSTLSITKVCSKKKNSKELTSNPMKPQNENKSSLNSENNTKNDISSVQLKDKAVSKLSVQGAIQSSKNSKTNQTVNFLSGKNSEISIKQVSVNKLSIPCSISVSPLNTSTEIAKNTGETKNVQSNTKLAINCSLNKCKSAIISTELSSTDIAKPKKTDSSVKVLDNAVTILPVLPAETSLKKSTSLKSGVKIHPTRPKKLFENKEIHRTLDSTVNGVKFFEKMLSKSSSLSKNIVNVSTVEKVKAQSCLNGIHSDLSVQSTIQENQQRITSLRKSLEKLARDTATACTLTKDIPEVSNMSSKFPDMDTAKTSLENLSTSGGNDKVGREGKLAPIILSYGPLQSQVQVQKNIQSTVKEKSRKQVTSPKLSLKRKVNEDNNLTEKRPKLNFAEQNGKIPPLLDAKSDSSIVPSTTLQNDCKEITPWNSSDDNPARYKKLLEFSKSFMNATPEEQSKICKNMLSPLHKAEASFINSTEFSDLLDLTLKKIKLYPKEIFVHLQGVKNELKAYKQKKELDNRQRTRHKSTSSDQSEVTKSASPVCFQNKNGDAKPPTISSYHSEAVQFASQIGLCLREENMETSTPSLKEHLHSAIQSITSNLKPKESSDDSSYQYEFPCIPSTSKQADIIENLHLSIPENYKLPSESEQKIDPSSNLLPVNGLFLPVRNMEKPSPISKPSNRQNDGDAAAKKLEEKVKSLEQYLGKLDAKIKKLQTKELSLDDLDNDDSTYILEDRYKRKFQKTWVTLCRIKKRSSLVGREMERRFTYKGSRYDEINKAVEKLINKRKPAEKFPNYVEIYILMKKVNEDAQLGLSNFLLEKTAKEAFEDVGTELKQRRQLDEERDFGCYLTDNLSLETDPAEQDEELKCKLSSSVTEGERKLKEIIDKFAAQQTEEPANEENMEVDESECSTERNENEIDDLPETDPATPSTDGREDDPEPIKVSCSPKPKDDDVIDIGSSSDASTEPGSIAVEVKKPFTILNSMTGPPVYITDEIEIVEGDAAQSDDSSDDLPSLLDIIR